MMPYWTPHGEKMYYKHELGHVTGDALLLAYREVHASIDDAIDDAFKGGFPIDIVRGALKALNDLAYGLTWRAVTKSGVRIGDQSYDMIFGRAEEEINKVIGMIDETKAKIERELIKPIRDKIRTEIEPAVDDLLSRVKTAEATVGKIEDRIDDARRDLEKHTGDIKELFDRVKTLEGKTTEQGNLLDWFKGKIGG